jgi:hypothetical protein
MSLASEMVSAPLVKECPVQMEATTGKINITSALEKISDVPSVPKSDEI